MGRNVSLRQIIEQEIRKCGPIPFSRYMELCLYHPGLGYYSRQAEQFGKAGDFYTSSDVHAVFGRLLVRQFEEMWRVLGNPESLEVLELGPGRGLFAQDVLDWSEKKFPDLFAALRYTLVESSVVLRERLQATLSRHFETGKAALGKGCIANAPAPIPRSLSPQVPLIVFANEFFDALPVEIISFEGELRIDSRNGRFIETWMPLSAAELEFLDRYGVHPEPGERIETPLLAQQYMDAVVDSVPRGFVVVIDYGYTRDELLAGRHRGTVTAYRRHSAGSSPYEAPGEQDITAHVNFTGLAAAAESHGMQVEKLLTQAQFLMGIAEPNQFADAFEECRLPQEKAKVALQLKHLVTPAGMGETFHVLIGSKGVEKLEQLSGLRFGRSRL